MALRSPRLRRLITSDIVYLPGERINNFFARMDRGRFCREPEGYRKLALEAGFEIREAAVERCHPRTGLAKYWMMTLEPRAS
jgi:hypothetical protein